MKLLPSEHLTQHEIDAASAVVVDRFNPQQQRRIEWPEAPVVAHAYLDQLGRSNAVPAERASALRAALDKADRALEDETKDSALAGELDQLASALETDGASTSGRSQFRVAALAKTVQGIAASLR